MEILNQLYYSAKRVIIDGKAIAIRLVSFIFIIGLLGTVFGSSFEVGSIDKIDIVYYVEDSGKTGQEFMDTLTQLKSIKSMIRFKEVESFDAGKKAVYEEKAGAFVYIPKEFTKNLSENNKKATADVYCQKYSGVNRTIIQSVMDSYVNGMNTGFIVRDLGGEMVDYTPDIKANIKTEPVSKKFQMSALQYYTVSMLLLLILYGAEYGCFGMSEDFIGALGERIRVSPLKASHQYIGKLIGFSLATFLQAIVVMMFSSVAFNVTWGDDLPLLMATILTFCVLSNIFGMMLIAIIRDLKKAGPLVFISLFTFTFLAGGFVATDFNGIEKISPSYYAKTALFNIIQGGKQGITLANIAIMWGIIIIFSCISILAARRKQV